MTTSSPVTNALKQYFGFNDFLDGQKQAVDKIVEGKDVCVVMPTGAGKSVCYQLPALLRDGYTIVISPLIALMKDQVENLVNKGIPAVFVNSTQSPREQNDNIAKVMTGEAKLLYVSPERLRAKGFKQILMSYPPACLVVDEAHCISQWGHDFRPDYTRMGEFIESFNIPQVCAFTATATPVVREDIKKQLGRKNMDILVTGFTRPNLSFSVVDCSSTKKMEALRKLLAKKEPTLIYCASRKNVDELSSLFGIKSYHAGMSDKDREEAQNYFINDPCPIMAATNAFGMGIDRADIRRVIHFNFPGSIEAYYQEAGRAGRDGEQSECIILYNYSDKFIHEFLIEMNSPTEEVTNETWIFLKEYIKKNKVEIIEITQTEIASKVRSAKGDQQISGALKMLEKHNYIERGFKYENNGNLIVYGDLQKIYKENCDIKTQRSIFISRIINKFQDELSEGISISLNQLCQVTGLNDEQVKRVLRAFDEDLISWTPPFGGRNIKVISDATKLEIDFSEVSKKAELDFAKLDKVLDYINSKMCRQDFMIKYFGQLKENFRCQTCDICTSHKKSGKELRQATDKEAKILRTVLKAADEHNGYIGKVKLAQVLCGSKSKQIIDASLNYSNYYNALEYLEQTEIIEIIDSLTSAGYLNRSSGKYPTIILTTKGKNVLNAGNITVELGAIAPPTAKQVEASGPLFKNISTPPKNISKKDPEKLYQELRNLRNQIAEKFAIQPYMVFNNLTLQELAEKQPANITEFKEIKGVGDLKAKQFAELFLAAINHN